MSFVRKLKSGQVCQVHTFDVATGEDRVIFRTQEILLEAPNWLGDGHLLLNGDGKLWKLTLDGVLTHVQVDGIPDINNDHVLSRDHKTIYMSAYDDWQIYKSPAQGGKAQQLTPGAPQHMYFLHGVTADETELAYVLLKRDGEKLFANGRVHLLDLVSGADRELNQGSAAEDGCEYSLDDQWVYFNSEEFSPNAQIARVRRDGSDLERLTHDERVNWFPHQSFDGDYWVYLSYPSGTEGHPADLSVELKLVKNGDWANPKRLNGFQGGQGTINVNSWHRYSPVFAYVSYPNT